MKGYFKYKSYVPPSHLVDVDLLIECIFIAKDLSFVSLSLHTVTQLISLAMSPSAMPIETISELTNAGIKHTIAKTAPSTAINGFSSSLAELDASKLIITRNTNPKTVPEPNSPEVWSQSVYALSLEPLL